MKKIFSILALMAVVVTAGAFEVKTNSVYKCSVAYTVNGTEVATADEGTVVTVKVTPDEGYAVKDIFGNTYTEWNAGRAASVDILGDVEITKVKDNEYTFTMPRASVKVTVNCQVQVPTPTEEGGAKKEATLKMTETGETTTDGTIAVAVESVVIPATTQKEVTVIVDATYTVGSNTFKVTKIGANAFKSNSATKVTKVVLPETETPLEIEDGAMKPDGKALEVETSLALLDDYAVAAALKDNFEGKKISAVAAAPNRYWTFSCGVDVVVPEGVTVYGAYNHEGTIRILPIDEVNSSKVIKANNGVIMACTSGKGGEKYQMVASPTGPKTGEKLAEAKTDANSYAGNCMAPTTQAANYDASEILILKDNEFHTIASSTTDKVPACKAVYSFSK